MTQFIWDHYVGEVREACERWDDLVRQHGEEGARERFWTAVAPEIFQTLEPRDIKELIELNFSRARFSGSRPIWRRALWLGLAALALGWAFYLHQFSETEQELLHPRPLKRNHRLLIIIHRLAADHHPIAKLGMTDTVAGL